MTLAFSVADTQAISAIQSRIAALLPYGSPSLRIVVLAKILAEECVTASVPAEELVTLYRALVER